MLIGVRLWAGAAVSKLCRNWGLQALANGAQADPRGQDPQGQAMKEAALGMATYQLYQLRQTVESKVDIGVDIIRAYRRFPWSWPELDYYFFGPCLPAFCHMPYTRCTRRMKSFFSGSIFVACSLVLATRCYARFTSSGTTCC